MPEQRGKIWEEKHLTRSLPFFVFVSHVEERFPNAFATVNKRKSFKAVKNNPLNLAFVSLKYGDTNHVPCLHNSPLFLLLQWSFSGAETLSAFLSPQKEKKNSERK